MGMGRISFDGGQSLVFEETYTTVSFAGKNIGDKVWINTGNIYDASGHTFSSPTGLSLAVNNLLAAGTSRSKGIYQNAQTGIVLNVDTAVSGYWVLYRNNVELMRGSLSSGAYASPMIILVSDANGNHALWDYSGSRLNDFVFAAITPENGVIGSCYTQGMISNASQQAVVINDIYEPIIIPTDPYGPVGPSGPGAGDGTFDFSSTPIDFTGPPTIGAYDTGMIDLYVPTAAQLKAMAQYLWAGAFDPDNFKKLFADPMDAVLGLSILPVTSAEIGVVPNTLVIGNISTGLSMSKASKQYVQIDCGSISILPKWGAYLDFSPYTKLQLFLPYIGYVDISPDDCMNGTIAVRYTVDILSGALVAQVKCNDHVLYELAGSGSCQCPITAGQYLNGAVAILRMAGTGAQLGGAIATGGAAGITSAAAGSAETMWNTVQDMVKPNVQRSGGFGSTAGLMGHQIPYLILTVPRMCIPGDQNKMIGYPSYVTMTLGDITGFCRVEILHPEGMSTESAADLEEIMALLKEGVYL